MEEGCVHVCNSCWGLVFQGNSKSHVRVITEELHLVIWGINIVMFLIFFISFSFQIENSNFFGGGKVCHNIFSKTLPPKSFLVPLFLLNAVALKPFLVLCVFFSVLIG